MENKKISKLIGSALWSYDVDEMDLKKDSKIIIESVLNHGTDEQLIWLFKTYSVKEMKEVVKNPSKGFWYPQSLNYWHNFLKIKIDKDIYENAIKKIYPHT